MSGGIGGVIPTTITPAQPGGLIHDPGRMRWDTYADWVAHKRRETSKLDIADADLSLIRDALSVGLRTAITGLFQSRWHMEKMKVSK